VSKTQHQTYLLSRQLIWELLFIPLNLASLMQVVKVVRLLIPNYQRLCKMLNNIRI